MVKIGSEYKVSGGRILSSSVKKEYYCNCFKTRGKLHWKPEGARSITIFKRIAFRKGRVAAITATARKIAIVIWNMIVRNEPYSSNRIQVDNEKHRRKQLKQVQRNIRNLKLNSNELSLLIKGSFTPA